MSHFGRVGLSWALSSIQRLEYKIPAIPSQLFWTECRYLGIEKSYPSVTNLPNHPCWFLDCSDWMSSSLTMTTLHKLCLWCDCKFFAILWIMFGCLLVIHRPSKLCHSAVCIVSQFVVTTRWQKFCHVCFNKTVHCSLNCYNIRVMFVTTVHCIQNCYQVCHNVSLRVQVKPIWLWFQNVLMIVSKQNVNNCQVQVLVIFFSRAKTHDK